MTDKLKPLLKRIDDLCKPIFKLGGEKGVKAKDIEKNYNKGPLSELAFDLLSCLYESKRQLEDLNRNVVKASSALKEQDHKIQELDASLEEKEAAEKSLLQEILTEVKNNGTKLEKINITVRENEEKIATEAGKVSSYAEILKKAVDAKSNSENTTAQRTILAKRVISEMRTSSRKKNIVLYGVGGYYNGDRIDFQEDMEDVLSHLGFPDVKPDSIELLKPAIHTLERPVEKGRERVVCTVRLQFPNETIPSKMLRNASRLKDTICYKQVYVAPDRTVEEQKERSQLVEKLKLMIKQQPKTKWVIKGGKVVSAGQWDSERLNTNSLTEIVI